MDNHLSLLQMKEAKKIHTNKKQNAKHIISEYGKVFLYFKGFYSCLS